MKNRLFMVIKVTFVTLSSLLLSSLSYASGFALTEQSASGMGSAYAGAAAIAEDASTLYFNPAGMAYIKKRQAVGVVHNIRPNAKFKNKNSTIAPALGAGPLTGDASEEGARDAIVPNLYYVHQLNPKLNLGLGINVPFGMATHYDDNWIGRYHAIESKVATINFNPSVSYRITDTVAFGFGINLQTIDVTLSSAIDFGSLCYGALSKSVCNTMGVEAQKADGYAYLTGDDSVSFGWNLGTMWQLTDKSRIGLAYRSRIKHSVDGKADFTVPGSVAFFTDDGLFTDMDLTADVTLPDLLSLSLINEFSDRLTFLIDVNWTGWNVFEELRIKYENPEQPDSATTEEWRNTLRYSMGAHFRLNKMIKFRSGLAYDQTAIPNAERRTPRVPGNDRTWVSIGVSIEPMKYVVVDLGYSHLFVATANINNAVESESELAPVIAANLNGEYEGSADILSAQVTWTF